MKRLVQVRNTLNSIMRVIRKNIIPRSNMQVMFFPRKSQSQTSAYMEMPAKPTGFISLHSDNDIKRNELKNWYIYIYVMNLFIHLRYELIRGFLHTTYQFHPASPLRNSSLTTWSYHLPDRNEERLRRLHSELLQCFSNPEKIGRNQTIKKMVLM